MNPHKLPYGQLKTAYRTFAAKAAAAEAPRSISLQKETPKVSKTANGVVFASWENNYPLSRIAVVYNAGSRHEHSDNLGVTHALRVAAGLSATNATQFGITRELEQIGANIRTSFGREYIMYGLDVVRSELDTGLNFLVKVAGKPAFKFWEIRDSADRLRSDLSFIEEWPEARLVDLLHTAAYRTGLGNSLFVRPHAIGSHNNQVVAAHFNEHCTPNNTIVVGVGIGHDHLKEYVGKRLTLENSKPSPNPNPASKYHGGELRLNTKHAMAHIVVAGEGASAKNPKEALAANVLKKVIGSKASVYQGIPRSSKLHEAASKATEGPFGLKGFNAVHSDSGLVGFSMVATPRDAGKVLKAVMDQFVKLGSGGIDAKDVERAKNQLKAKVLSKYNNGLGSLTYITREVLARGQASTQEEIEKEINAVTLGDVQALLKRALGGKLSMAAVGRIDSVPYLDTLK